MQDRPSFGYWLRLKRKSLDLTREALADRVGCSVSTIRKLEEDERRPSAQIAELLAGIFKVPATERAGFLRFARGDWRSTPSPGEEDSPWHVTGAAPASPPRSNLPATFTSLIGREKDIAAVQGYLSNPDVRLVTLIGAPGIGKTRLSIAAAGQSAAQFPDGVFFVALAPLDHPSLIPSSVLQALGLAETNRESIEERIIDGIGSKRLLIVLDNCEHLIEAVTQLVSSLLSACPSLRVLISSREALQLPGEWLYSVPALETPKEYSRLEVEAISRFPALVLFAERARAARSDFALNADNAGLAASICARLDGLPLAIELIAARIKTLSIEQIAARLDDRFVLLTSSSRNEASRQQTLRASLDWSYELLAEAERELFRQLAVFAGGFTLEALESVAQLDAHQAALPVLSRLVDKSLVVVEQHDDARYQLLETVRQYAQEKLRESGRASTAHDRHLAYYLTYAEEAEPHIFGTEQRAWANRLEVEHDNLRAALSWSLDSNHVKEGLQIAGALAWFWHNNGHLREGSRWLEKMLASDHGRRGTEQAKALRAVSMISTYMGDYTRAKERADSSIKLYREVGDDRGAGLALTELGSTLRLEGKREEAIELLRKSLSLLQTTGERWGIAYAQVLLGDAWFRLGDIERAATEWEASLRLTRELGDYSLMTWSLGGLADVARLRGEFGRALEMLKQALNLYRELGNRSQPPFTLEAMGLVAAALGDAKRAARLWGAAAAWREAVNEPLPSTFQQDYAASMSRARSQLGETVYASAWSDGHAMSPEEAIGLALED